MKKHLHWSYNQPEAEVPGRLDTAIMLAASLQARRIRRGRNLRLVLSSAAALIIVSLTIFAFMPIHQKRATVPAETLSQEELLSLGDWTSFEQENYAVNSSCYEFQELSRNFEDSLI